MRIKLYLFNSIFSSRDKFMRPNGKTMNKNRHSSRGWWLAFSRCESYVVGFGLAYNTYCMIFDKTGECFMRGYVCCFIG